MRRRRIRTVEPPRRQGDAKDAKDEERGEKRVESGEIRPQRRRDAENDAETTRGDGFTAEDAET